MRTYLLAAFVLVCCNTFAQNWFSSPVNNGRDVNTIKIFNRDTIVVAGGWKLNNGDSTRSVFKTENGGLALWNVPVDGNEHWIRSMEFTNLLNGIAVCDGGRIVKTSDGGWHWTPENAPINRDLNRIFFIDAQNMIIVGGKRADTAQAHLQTILKSTNGGQTWSVVLDQPGFILNSVYFPTPTTGYAVGDSGVILKTTNGGDNWSVASVPIQRNFNSIWFTDANNGFIVGGYPARDSIQTILRTTNGGNNWNISKDQPSPMLRDIHFADANTGYAVGDSATVLKTTNGGQAWNTITIPGTYGHEQFNAVRFYSPDFGYVSGKDGVQFIYNEEALPQVFTDIAEVTDSISATLHALINSQNELAAFRFVFSEAPDFSSGINESAYPGYIKSGIFTDVSHHFTDLTPNTTHYYFVRAWTLGGTVQGDTFSFRTGTSTSEIKTIEPTNVTQTTAQLHGTIRGYGGTVNLFFEYGTTPSFGTQVIATPASINDTALQSVTATISGLQTNTFYYYRLKAVAGAGSFYGNTQFLFTGGTSFFSELSTLPATNITDTSATFSAFISGFRVPANLSFEYSPDFLTFNQNISAGSVNDSLPHSLNVAVSGLIPNTLYYYRIKAQTPIGSFYGDTLAFYSRSGYPNLKTTTATGVTTNSAQLNGSIQQISETIVSTAFEYGVSAPFPGEAIATPAAINDTLEHFISASVSGLQNNTLYYYRLKAETAQGATLYGDVKQFYTGTPTIPNWDFQNWNQKTVPVITDWYVVGESFERVSDLAGDHALKLNAPNIMFMGIFKGFTDSGAVFNKYVPFHHRPDSIVFRAQFDLPPNDTLACFVLLKDGDTLGGYQQCKIAGSSGGGYKRLVFPIEYRSSIVPDSIAMILMIGTQGTSITIDEISFTPDGPPLPNDDFNSWFDYTFTELADWKYIKYLVIDSATQAVAKPVIQGIYSAPSDFAAELQTQLAPNGDPFPGELGTSFGILGSPQPSFPVDTAHFALNGYFKYFPAPGDSMEIRVGMMKGDHIVGGGDLILGETIDTFQLFEIPITYYSDTLGNIMIPDSAIIAMTCTQGMVQGISRLIVDKLSFDGIRGYLDVGIPPYAPSLSGLTLFPNPTAATVTVRMDGDVQEQLQLDIYNMEGKSMYRTFFTSKSVEISVADFPKGIYMLQVSDATKKIMGKFMVVK